MNRVVSWGEVRLALRLLVKQPILSLTIILALATGMGLATMGFTFRDALMSSVLPYRAGERTARIQAFSREGRQSDIVRAAVVHGDAPHARDRHSRRTRSGELAGAAIDHRRSDGLPAVGGVLGSLLGVAFVQLRSSILISIPAPGYWMPSTIFLTLAIAGLTACWLPARRALGIRPSESLSAD